MKRKMEVALIKKLVGLIIVVGFILALAGTAEATQFFDTPVDKSLTTTGSWVDIDLSGDIPNGATGIQYFRERALSLFD